MSSTTSRFPVLTTPLPEVAREFDYTYQDFERVRRLAHELAGISLSDSKQDLVYSRLSRRLRALHLKRMCDYLDLLEKPNSEERQGFLNAITTNLTAFFREQHHFPVLSELLLSQRGGGPLQIWCAASSSGEEAYSIAITACEAFGTMQPPVKIIASDIDTQVLAIAEAGRYGVDRCTNVTPVLRQKYFLPSSASHPETLLVRPELKSLISFQQINLLAPSWPLQAPMAAIFCRNVMIYFSKATQRQLLTRFVPMLMPEGRLFIGHSESLHHSTDLFRSLGRTVYCRADISPRPGEMRPAHEARTAAGDLQSGQSAAPGMMAKPAVAPQPTPSAPIVKAGAGAPVGRDERVVVVGASTGGTDSIKAFLSGMESDCPAILVVQHMPAAFTAAFARRLDETCRIEVKEAADGEVIRRGTAYIAPGHSHLSIERQPGGGLVCRLAETAPVNRHRPSVEVLFLSAARWLGAQAVGVMMSGMGKDGASAMLALRNAGAYNFAQDEATCVVFGMPREAILLGAVHEVLPLPDLAPKVSRLCARNGPPIAAGWSGKV